MIRYLLGISSEDRYKDGGDMKAIPAQFSLAHLSRWDEAE